MTLSHASCTNKTQENAHKTKIITETERLAETEKILLCSQCNKKHKIYIIAFKCLV